MPSIPGDTPMRAMMRYAQQGQTNQPAGQSGNWLAVAINAVHEGMVEESDPDQVSLLGAIINQLTTFQAKRMSPKGQGASGGV